MLRYKDVFLLLSALFYLAILAGGQVLFAASGALDSQLIERLAEEGTAQGRSYAAMAALYLMIPDGTHMLFTASVGLACIFAYFWQVRRREAALVIAFLSLAPSILTLATFQKDTALALFVLASFALLLSPLGRVQKVLGLLAVYGLYGALFREYYFVIAVFFVMLVLLRQGNRVALFYILLIGAFSLIFIPPELYEVLQGSRDEFNTVRLNRPAWQRPRTAFLNPLPPDGLWNFLVNYLHAIFRLNFFVLISPGVKELFLLMNSALYIGFFAWGWRQSGPGAAPVALAGALGLAHLLVLHLFEPDNGSYVRHLGSTLPYLGICINAFFERWRLRVL